MPSQATYGATSVKAAARPTSAYEYNGTGQLGGRAVEICYWFLFPKNAPVSFSSPGLLIFVECSVFYWRTVATCWQPTLRWFHGNQRTRWSC